MRPEQILAALDDEQRVAVTAPPGPVLIVAGAGTGKTRTVTHRIAYHVATGTVPGGCVLAVTHSSKAAGEMRDRLTRFGVNGAEQVAARTFHAAALRQLRHFWTATSRPGREPVLLNPGDRYATIRAALRRVEKADPDTTTVFDVAAEIAWAKTQLVTPGGYTAAARAAGRVPLRPHTIIAKTYDAYEQAKNRTGTLDFDDLLAVCAQLIETDTDVATVVRGRYRFLVVDECQDTDPAQMRLLHAWLGPDNDVITACGDPRQAIYAFKGATGEFLTGFTTRHPDAQVVHLTRDYRSVAPIVAAANALVATGADHTPDLVSVPGDGPKVTVRALPDETSEATWVASQVRRALAAGVPPREIAILYRYHSQSAPFEQALTAAGVPYVVADDEKFFDRPEIVAVLTEMRRRLERAATRGAGWDDEYDSGGGEDLLSGPSLLREVLADFGFGRDTPPAGAGALRDRWEAHAALLDLVEGMPSADLLGGWPLLEDLETRRAEAHTVTADVVTLATLHKAKGLEWDSVFLPRLVEGSLPSMYATTPAQLAEERRLFYVGITRAKRILVVTGPRARDQRRGTCTPSRFLADAGLVDRPATVTPTRTARTATPTAPRSRAGAGRTPLCRTCRAELPAAAAPLGQCGTHLHGEEARLFAALRAWRTKAAREAATAPYKVLTDTTLLALVAARPTDDTALLAVPGIGPAKLDKYGAALLELLRPPT